MKKKAYFWDLFLFVSFAVGNSDELSQVVLLSLVDLSCQGCWFCVL